MFTAYALIAYSLSLILGFVDTPAANKLQVYSGVKYMRQAKAEARVQTLCWLSSVSLFSVVVLLLPMGWGSIKSMRTCGGVCVSTVCSGYNYRERERARASVYEHLCKRVCMASVRSVFFHQHGLVLLVDYIAYRRAGSACIAPTTPIRKRFARTTH